VSPAVEAAGRLVPIRALFPHRATQHVLTGVLVEGVVLMITAAYGALSAVPLSPTAGARPAGPDDGTARALAAAADLVPSDCWPGAKDDASGVRLAVRLLE
jgi:hypothetical protein